MILIHIFYFISVAVKADDELNKVIQSIRDELTREKRQTGGPSNYPNQYNQQYANHYQTQHIPTQRPTQQPTQSPVETVRPQSRAKEPEVAAEIPKLIDLASDIRNFFIKYGETHKSDRVSHFIFHLPLISLIDQSNYLFEASF